MTLIGRKAEAGGMRGDVERKEGVMHLHAN